MKNSFLVLIIPFALTACAASTPKDELREELHEAPVARGAVPAEELRLYIKQTKPETVSYIRYQQPFRWKALNSYFAITDARSGPHLIEMSWECNELISGELLTDMVDRRSDNRLIRAGIDTIRGCRIKNFYKLPKPEPVEEGREADPT